ncbi:hypothetical protein VNO77_23753 [Canavalia gladiata]|uniref:Ubiquitinyl hydrolase 1 n=1 Tax=Canavalia gladiata TaxID=3824 RepID=A0AAN9QFL4_CANGL
MPTTPLDLLHLNLSRVRIPEKTNRIHKHECCVSFDSPKSEGGLFVDLYSFVAFGKDFVGWNYEKTGNSVYLHIKQTTKFLPEDHELEYEETHSIVILPQYVCLPFPYEDLPEKVKLAAYAILLAHKKQGSPYAMNLQQINNGVVIPPSGWKCAKCDKKHNLWLNLTDGIILFYGSKHTIEHYQQTGYPLALKLDTISADLEAAHVFSYPENLSVFDPQLSQHLAFFGIDSSWLQRTKMMTDADENTNFDWNRIQESGEKLNPIFGPGYTGLVNIGNSCYMAAIIPKYAVDKFASGLLSGDYSVPSFGIDENKNFATSTITFKQEGIRPSMFKSVIAPEYSSMDALDFFLHFLHQFERANAGEIKPYLDPSRSFKFGIEDRILCSSGKVSYKRRHEYILSLNIPLDEATNKEDLESFHEGKEIIHGNWIVRPRVPLKACLANFLEAEEIRDFYSSALKRKTRAVKSVGLTSFPDYLVLHMRRFVMERGAKKLNAYVDVPDIIDISHTRSKGHQYGEDCYLMMRKLQTKQHQR